jgi:hypothetical protein
LAETLVFEASGVHQVQVEEVLVQYSGAIYQLFTLFETTLCKYAVK